MRKTELVKFRKKLELEHERISQALAKRSKIIRHAGDEAGGDGGKAHSNHMADQGSDEFQYETTIKHASTEGQLLYQVEQALSRIEDGSYGKCETCGSAINLPRMRALPYARLCIECKEKEEAGSF